MRPVHEEITRGHNRLFSDGKWYHKSWWTLVQATFCIILKRFVYIYIWYKTYWHTHFLHKKITKSLQDMLSKIGSDKVPSHTKETWIYSNKPIIIHILRKEITKSLHNKICCPIIVLESRKDETLKVRSRKRISTLSKLLVNPTYLQFVNTLLKLGADNRSVFLQYHFGINYSFSIPYDKKGDMLETAFSNANFFNKITVFWYKCHWGLFLSV